MANPFRTARECTATHPRDNPLFRNYFRRILPGSQGVCRISDRAQKSTADLQ